ncbi:hypothetical protein [Agathobacter rectalis]|uniref:hypothetical protein n=1 Tax=Agathobacter rectalis TaxID=39491 RepID=UPI0036F31663
MEVGRILPTEAAVILNVSPQFIRISMDSSPDIIKDASDALKPIEDRGITVMQGWYDKDLNKCHVTLWDFLKTAGLSAGSSTDVLYSTGSQSD